MAVPRSMMSALFLVINAHILTAFRAHPAKFTAVRPCSLSMRPIAISQPAPQLGSLVSMNGDDEGGPDMFVVYFVAISVAGYVGIILYEFLRLKLTGQI